MSCKDCLHYEACKGTYDILDTTCSGEFDYEKFARSCKNFTDRSEWVHLPDDGYTFMVRGDIAKSLIIANCRAAEAEKALEEKK
ncbi:MAG: hypothetical protein ACLU40_03790 [Acutalibacteraceae bacterium]